MLRLLESSLGSHNRRHSFRFWKNYKCISHFKFKSEFWSTEPVTKFWARSIKPVYRYWKKCIVIRYFSPRTEIHLNTLGLLRSPIMFATVWLQKDIGLISPMYSESNTTDHPENFYNQSVTKLISVLFSRWLSSENYIFYKKRWFYKTHVKVDLRK